MTIQSKILFSNVCRVTNPVLKGIAKPGMVEIPDYILAPRQIRLTEDKEKLKDLTFPSMMKFHRESMISTITNKTAGELVDNGFAAYEPQYLLSYTREEYLNDKDVINDVKEFERISNSNAEVIIVAVIGESRSPLAVCRNIVSGCQDIRKLVSDAEGAIKSKNVLLIED